MPINVRVKGQNGEREIATLLNGILITVLKELSAPNDLILRAASSVQRNQNQSAVGGGDLINTFGLSIEVKRQEILNVDAWWRQCHASASRNKEWPVLLYRQNNKPWRCRTVVNVTLPDESQIHAIGDINYLAFQAWYKEWITIRLRQGEQVKS